jgi:hypothetical protein
MYFESWFLSAWIVNTDTVFLKNNFYFPVLIVEYTVFLY